MFSKCLLVSPLLAAAASALPQEYASPAQQEYASTTTFAFSGTALPTGLVRSNWPVGEHQYVNENAVVEGGFLNLIVPGGQKKSEVIAGGEISTTFKMSAARVETYAVLTDVEGVCNGMFLYESDQQEVDIEWLSDSTSQSNIDSGRGRALWYTNQAVVKGGKSTHDMSDAPEDAFSAVHNYRIDWDGGETSSFYLDGEQKYEFTTNVPTNDSSFLWNNWSNGDQGWSAGPPKEDAVFKIQKIVMAYNPAS
ncbi:hypothetical protein Q7P37_010400 [Cladosporium fusiforme]